MLLQTIVNQLLFTTTIFCDFLEMNQFPETNFRNQCVDYLENKKPETTEDWFMVRNIPEPLACLDFLYRNKSWLILYVKNEMLSDTI